MRSVRCYPLLAQRRKNTSEPATARPSEIEKGTALSKVTKELPAGGGDRPGNTSFLPRRSSRHYGRISPDRPAILAPGGQSLTYGALWARTNEIVRELRDFGIGRSDRVAVVLPGGPELRWRP